MKTASDPRHIERVKVIKELFSWEFSNENQLTRDSVNQIIKNLNPIDEQIQKAAPSWPLEKINKIDLAILRLAVFELMFKKDIPQKVIIDEAVELAKEYGSDTSPGFVNAALGKLLNDLENKI